MGTDNEMLPLCALPQMRFYQTYNENCQLRNVLGQYLDATPHGATTIVLIGDQIDMDAVSFVCAAYAALGHTDFISHINNKDAVNYCLLPTGLLVVHAHIHRKNLEDDRNVLSMVQHFLRGNDTYTGNEEHRSIREKHMRLFPKRKADVVVFSSSSEGRRYNHFAFSTTRT